MRKLMVIMVLCCFLAVGCSGMSYTTQRTLSGGAIGAASGAAIGAIAGNAGAGAAIGGGAGLLGGYIYDQYKKSRGEP
ncbi:MAG: YMGG-like glycine zipper-containing protein [Desulfobacca sp.]|uniref:YMGG-like glycine zipper-containing protein n=1 Tax=Desulfobacca sp. TaxID=2067990 RepID=UPI0040498646